MNTSETTLNIYPAFFNLQQELRTMKRDKVVKVKSDKGAFEFRYTPLDTIMEELRPLMGRQGLAVMQAVGVDLITTRLIHKSGEWIESQTMLNTKHANMKDYGGEITYKRRYALSALLGLVSDEDTDVPRHSATKGILATLEERRQSVIVDTAEYIKDQHAEKNEWEMYTSYVGITDSEERTALWGLLPSNIRTRLTAMHQEELAKDKK